VTALTITLTPLFRGRRLWRLMRLLMPVLAVVGVVTSIVDLSANGWSRQGAVDAATVPLFAGGSIMYALLGRSSLTLADGRLRVREFMRLELTVPLSDIQHLLVATLRYLGRTWTTYVITTASGSAVAYVPARTPRVQATAVGPQGRSAQSRRRGVGLRRPSVRRFGHRVGKSSLDLRVRGWGGHVAHGLS